MRKLFVILCWMLTLAAAYRAVTDAGEKKPADKTPAGEIEKLVKQLGNDNPQTRGAASKAIATIGIDALPLLEAAKKSKDLELRLRAEMLHGQIMEAWLQNKAEKAMRFGIDVLVERMVRKGKKATDEDWQVLGHIIDRIRRDGGGKDIAFPATLPGLATYRKLPVRVDADGLKERDVFGSRMITENLVTKHSPYESIIMNSGHLSSNGGLSSSIVFANGDLHVGAVYDSIVICDGNVRLHNANRSLILAREKIRVISGTTTRDNVIEEDYRTGISNVRFFSVRDLGIQLAEGRTDRITIPFQVDPGSLLGKAGLKRGDLIGTVNGEKIKAGEDGRRLFRRAVSEGVISIGFLSPKKPIKVDIPW